MENPTQTNGISYNNAGCNTIFAYCNSDFAGNKESPKNTTGYIIFYWGGSTAWCSRKQEYGLAVKYEIRIYRCSIMFETSSVS